MCIRFDKIKWYKWQIDPHSQSTNYESFSLNVRYYFSGVMFKIKKKNTGFIRGCWVF